MRNFQHQQNNPHKKIAVFFVVVISAMMVLLPGLRESIVNTLSGTLTYRSKALAVGTSIEELTQSRQDLLARIDELEEQNEDLRYANVSADALRLQNKHLKDQLGRNVEEDNEDTSEDVLLGRVLSRPPLTPYDTLVVDLGSADGVERGMTVLASDSIQIGRVTDVFDATARIELYSSVGVRTPVEINGEGALYVAEGQGGGEITAHIPRNSDIDAGDTLTIPASDSRLIAEIQNTEAEETDPFILAQGSMPVNVFELSWVLIETQ